MPRIIEQVRFSKPIVHRLTNVAAYARVSSGKDEMIHSLAAQVDYYKDYIQSNPGWLFAGVYADEALTGTKSNRADFLRLLDDCRSGKIDRVLTKSISRFARNTVTLLETVRELKGLGVDVYFEEGMPWKGAMLGYRYDKGKYVVIPEEAEIVREIFRMYLGGYGVPAIIQSLKEQGAETEMGNQWSRTSITKILRNYTYTGNLLLQRVYRENHLTKKTLVNHGELPQYHATDTHEPIIDMNTFMAVQEEILVRAEKYTGADTTNTYPFTGKLVCANCGKHYRRKTTKARAVWICTTYNSMGKAVCDSKAIPEETLIRTTNEVLGIEEFDPGLFAEDVVNIKVESENRLIFILRGGTTVTKQWKDRSRSESWTPEKRAAAGAKTRKRHQEGK